MTFWVFFHSLCVWVCFHFWVREREREGKREREKGVRNSTITLWTVGDVWTEFQCHVFEESQEFGGCHCARENSFQRKKTEARPLAKQEVATHCLGWCSARRIVEWFYGGWPWGEGAQGRRHLPGLWGGEGGKEPRLSRGVLKMRPRQAHSWPLLVCEWPGLGDLWYSGPTLTLESNGYWVYFLSKKLTSCQVGTPCSLTDSQMSKNE